MIPAVPSTSEFSVRSLAPTDLQAVYDLVCELADFERLAGEVATSPEIYAVDLAAGWFQGLVAEDARGRVVGGMIYHQAYSTWRGRMLYLEDFIVGHTHRRLGIGELLWQHLVQEARARDCTSIKWQVLEWNDSAKSFYEKMGASLEAGWENGRLMLSSL